MKKTLLATAIIGALGASAAAQAATVYDQDGTTLAVDGRIAMAIFGGGEDSSAEFKDFYSRLGLSMSNQISNDLSAFGRVEWRFDGANRDTDQGFTEVRHSFVGLESNQFGTVQFGNFDGYYNSFVSGIFDVYLDAGFEFEGGATQARGSSIGYVTPNLDGFQAFVQAKHFSADETVDGSSDLATQGGVSFEEGPFKVALGFIDNNGNTGGSDEVIYGLMGSYAVNDALSVRLGYETESDVNDSVGLGASYAVGQLGFHADVYRISPEVGDSRTSWALGTYYTVSSNFNVFAEFHQDDQQDVTFGSDGITSESTDVQYVTGVRYMF